MFQYNTGMNEKSVLIKIRKNITLLTRVKL